MCGRKGCGDLVDPNVFLKRKVTGRGKRGRGTKWLVDIKRDILVGN